MCEFWKKPKSTKDVSCRFLNAHMLHFIHSIDQRINLKAHSGGNGHSNRQGTLQAYGHIYLHCEYGTSSYSMGTLYVRVPTP